MRVLVTGGAGFIGSHVVDALVSEGHEVLVVDNLMTGSIENLSRVSKRVRVYVGNFWAREMLRKILPKTEVVIHEAAAVGVEVCSRYPSLAKYTNVVGMERLLEEAIAHGVRRFVFASSAAVYGEQQKLPISEDAEPRPLSLYARTKLEGEKMCQRYFKKGLETVCLRYFNVYGERQNPAYAGVIMKFIEALRGGGRPVFYGDGSQSRDFIHVLDVARATVLAMEKECAGEVINVGSGSKTSVRELLELLCRLTGKRRVRVLHQPPRAGDIRESQADIRKAEKLLGFKPSISLEEGLRSLLQSPRR